MCGFTTKEQHHHYTVRIQQPNDASLCYAQEYFVMSTHPATFTTALDASEDSITAARRPKYRQAYGIHPYHAFDALNNYPNHMATLRQCLERAPHSFVGEIGLDKTQRHKQFFASHQVPLFVNQLRLAAELNRPVSIHSVKSDGALVDLLSAELRLPPALALHSFCGSPETLARIIKLEDQKKCEIFVGLNPTTNLTKKNVLLFLQSVGVHRMLIETDWSTDDYPFLHSNVQDIHKLLLNAVLMIANVLELEFQTVVAYLVTNTDRFSQSINPK